MRTATKYSLPLSFVLFSISIFQTTSAVAQDQIVKSTRNGYVLNQNSIAFEVIDSQQKGFSALYAQDSNGIKKFCKSLEEVGCDTDMVANTVLPICESDQSSNCLESLYTTTENSERRQLTYIRSIETKENYVYKPSSSRGLPIPGQISLWKDVSRDETKYYSVNASLALRSIGVGADLVFQPTDLSIELNQYVERAAPISTGIGPMQGTKGAGWNPPTSLKDVQCAWHEVGICGVSQVMDLNQNFEMTIHVSNEISGWIYGRLKGQAIDFQAISPEQNRITISGAPVQVPGILAELDYSVDSQLVNDYALMTRWIMPTKLYLPMTQFVMSDAGDSTILSAFSSVLKDKAQFSLTKWSMYTKPFLKGMPQRSQTEYKLKECMSSEKGIQGFVSSNAPIYESSPPVFDGVSLNYKVSGTHFKSDGSIFEGTYDLSIRSTLARCLYGFSTAPISASISVTSASGESSIKTTSFNETKSGWLNFSAAGFTFSSPTVQIFLTQELPIDSVAASRPTSSKQKIKAITCSKKRAIKKVTGTNPKCPAGYKRLD